MLTLFVSQFKRGKNMCSQTFGPLCNVWFAISPKITMRKSAAQCLHLGRTKKFCALCVDQIVKDLQFRNAAPLAVQPCDVTVVFVALLVLSVSVCGRWAGEQSADGSAPHWT